MEGDRRLLSGEGAKGLAERVLDLELAPRFELEDGGGGELLGDRGDVEDRARGIGSAMRPVGEAVALVEDDLPVLGDQGRAREAEGFERGEIAVERRAERPLDCVTVGDKVA